MIDASVYIMDMKNTDTTKTTDCKGCEWNGYSHRHNDAEDGPRSECCKHTCKSSK
jgi:hypothetical protein